MTHAESARAVKNMRKATGLTQPAFAKLKRISLRTLQGWESGRCRPRPNGMKKLKGDRG